jgi:hypothetical protein
MNLPLSNTGERGFEKKAGLKKVHAFCAHFIAICQGLQGFAY